MTQTTGYPCTTDKHGDSNMAWKRGCRHPGAIAAHERAKEAEHRREQFMPAAVDDDGNCIAADHTPGIRTYRRGCRCAPTVAAWERNRLRRLSAKRVRREQEYAGEYDRELDRTKRLTGGRLTHDPRRPWRGGRMAVSRVSLWFLVHGYCVRDVTQGERLAAVAILSGTMIEDDAWYKIGHLMNAADIARRTGCSEQIARRLTDRRVALRGERAARRLADRQWKDAVVAEAAGRKDREAQRHARAHADRQARQLEYVIRRYARERGRRKAAEYARGRTMWATRQAA